MGNTLNNADSVIDATPDDVAFPAPDAAAPARIEKPSKKRRWLIPVVVAAVVIVAGAATVVVNLMQEASPNRYEVAIAACDLADDPDARVIDDGAGLALHLKGKDDPSGLAYEDLTCMQTELNVPESLVIQMGKTRALDGTQSKTFDEIEATWSYHPDSGFDVVFVDVD